MTTSWLAGYPARPRLCLIVLGLIGLGLIGLGLLGPALDLSVFTGPGAAVTFRPDLAALGLPFGAIVLLAGAVLAIKASQTRRHGVAGLVRVL